MKFLFKLLLSILGLYFLGLFISISSSVLDPNDLIDKKLLIDTISWKIIVGGGIIGFILLIPMLIILSSKPEAMKKIKFHNFVTAYGVACSYRKELPWAWRLGKISLVSFFGGFLLVVYLNVLSGIL
jgi:hypothetical protein